jgi:hypothetical protein
VDLSAVKRDEGLLLSVLGIPKAGQHCKCPFHDDQHGSLSVWQHDDVWFWKCQAGCGKGTIIDAAALKFNATGPAAAIAALEREMGVRIGKDVEPIEPVLNMERADRLVRAAHENLMHNVKIQETYLLQKRNIANLQVVKDYRLGFVEDAAFQGWGWRLTGWVLPVTSADDRLLAVKMHLEKRIVDGPKALWCPFGVYPQNKPKHSVNTLWPPPERWNNPDQLWLCPGELKALAVISSIIGQVAGGWRQGVRYRL